MRVACAYLPSFPVQVHVRRAPHLAGRAFAVGDDSERPIVVACSRAAWEQGVRSGMSLARARRAAPGLIVRTHDSAAHVAALEALGESLLAYSATVDIGVNPDSDSASSANSLPARAHHAVYLRVPPGTRGAAFGDRLLSAISRQGFRGRVGIADDRFAAWAAATTIPGQVARSDEGEAAALFAQACTVVPRGGSAAFLAKQPLAMLPLDRDVQRMMGALGIRTLGDFGSLPPPTLGRRWNPTGVDYQALARGDDPTPLRAFAPKRPIAEGIELEDPLVEVEPLGFVLRPLFDRVCERLRGRDRAAGRIVLILRGLESPDLQLALTPKRPTISGRALLDLARTELANEQVAHPIASVEVVVMHEAEPEADELALFDSGDAAGDNVRLDPFRSSGRSPHRTRRGKRRRRRKKGDSPPRQGLFDR